MVHEIVERSCKDGGDKVRDEDRFDDAIIHTVERDEDGVVDDECGDTHDRPSEHAPIKMATKKGPHRGKLSASSSPVVPLLFG